jgi:hypothetical protein
LLWYTPEALVGRRFFLGCFEYREGDQFNQLFGVMSAPCFDCPCRESDRFRFKFWWGGVSRHTRCCGVPTYLTKYGPVIDFQKCKTGRAFGSASRVLHEILSISVNLHKFDMTVVPRPSGA